MSVFMGAWIQGKTDRRECFSATTTTDNLQQTHRMQIQQTIQAAGVGLTTIYKIHSEVKSTEGLFTFLKKNGNFRIITEQKEK